jgi:hypothetical protein
VRQHPPELRCWTLTSRMVRSASLLVKMSRSARVAKRRIRSSKLRNRRAMRRASFAVAVRRYRFAVSPAAASARYRVTRLSRTPASRAGHLHRPVLSARLEVVQTLQVAQQVSSAPGVQRVGKVPIACVAVADDDAVVAGQNGAHNGPLFGRFIGPVVVPRNGTTASAWAAEALADGRRCRSGCLDDDVAVKDDSPYLFGKL